MLAAAPGNPEFRPLFNGRDWTGWQERGQARFRIENGVIIGETGRGGHGWLCTTNTHGDFVLELEVRIRSGNAGIQFRSQIDERDVMVGYQIEVDPGRRAWSGGLYEQGRRGWLQNLTNNPAARAAFKVGEWNHYRIEAVGDRIRSWVNGVPAADYLDAMNTEGIIALQVHSGRDVRVEYRDIRIANLGRHVWKPLWNGLDLRGWRPIGQGSWQITEGAILGRHEASVADYGHLVTDRVFTDFVARLKFRSVKGNSGFYFRVAEEGFSGVTGFRAEIDPANDVGGLYETNGRQWVSRPAPAEQLRWFHPRQWNTLTVHAHGGRIKVDMNGQQVSELPDDPGRRDGKLALQLHGGQDVEVWFKDIEVLEPAAGAE